MPDATVVVRCEYVRDYATLVRIHAEAPRPEAVMTLPPWSRAGATDG